MLRVGAIRLAWSCIRGCEVFRCKAAAGVLNRNFTFAPGSSNQLGIIMVVVELIR